MTKPKQATERGLDSHYKVRIVIPGALLHVASWDEPRITPEGIEADWIANPEYGDTIGFIKWSDVVAITWRYAS